MLFFPVDPNVNKLYMTLLYLGFVGSLLILPVTVPAEESVSKDKTNLLPSGVALAKKSESGAKVAIFPFENMSGQYFDIDDLMKPFYQNLDKIFSLSSTNEIEEVILQLRLRHTGFLSSQEVLEIGQRLGVKAIILGMVCEYQDTPEPRIGLILKLIGTGKETPILWSKSVHESGDITESWFGRNRISKSDSLINKVAEDLINEMSIHLIQEAGN